MTGKVSIYDVGHSRPGSIGRRASGAVLVAWIAIFMTTAVNASEPAREPKAGADVADRLNHQQLALAAGPVAHPSPAAAAAEDVGILFLRSDGGDPQQLRADDRSNLIFIARRNGDGRAYRNGHEVEINPVLKESAGQIAVAQFGHDERVAGIAKQLRKRLPQIQDSLLAEASMTIGAHVGPGALSITVSPVL